MAAIARAMSRQADLSLRESEHRCEARQAAHVAAVDTG
jgi:hypothetical protein